MPEPADTLAGFITAALRGDDRTVRELADRIPRVRREALRATLNTVMTALDNRTRCPACDQTPTPGTVGYTTTRLPDNRGRQAWHVRCLYDPPEGTDQQ